MAKMHKLPILWSVDCDPHSIIEMMDDERISALIERGKFRCRIGSLLQNKSDIRHVVISSSEPHGLISDIYKEDDAWYGDLFIPEIKEWNDLVDNIKDPILHPLVNVNSNGEFRIVNFAIMDRTEIDRNRTYDGIHLIVPSDALEDVLKELVERRKERKEAILSGENVHMDNPQSMDYRIKSYEEYGATGKDITSVCEIYE